MIVTLFGGLTTVPGSEAEERQLLADLRAAAREHPGFISMKTYRADDGDEVGIIRFTDREALDAWMEHEGHRDAQRRGTAIYQSLWIQSAETFREYRWEGTARVEGDLTPLFVEGAN